MSANLVNLRTIQFSDKFQLLSQQYGSRLQGLVSQGQYQGKQASPVNQVAPTAAVPVTDRFTPIDRQDANFDRRWVFPLPYEHAQLVDKFDELQMLGDPKPSLVMNAANAMGRAKDDVILGAFFATAFVGVAFFAAAFVGVAFFAVVFAAAFVADAAFVAVVFAVDFFGVDFFAVTFFAVGFTAVDFAGLDVVAVDDVVDFFAVRARSDAAGTAPAAPRRPVTVTVAEAARTRPPAAATADRTRRR